MASVQGMKMESIQGGSAPREKSLRSEKSTDSKSFLSLLGKAGKNAKPEKTSLETLLLSGKSSGNGKSSLNLAKESGNLSKQFLTSRNEDLQKNAVKKQEEPVLALTEEIQFDSEKPATADASISSFLSEAGNIHSGINPLSGNAKTTRIGELSSSQDKKSPAKVEMLITVEDLRRKRPDRLASVQKDSALLRETALKGESVQNQRQAVNQGVKVEAAESGEKDFISEIKNPDGLTYSPQGGGGKMEAPVVREAAQAFQEHLTRSGNAEIVRKIQFVLKDNNAGEIKLVLRPESLGNVRIQLSMNENNIVGRIVVDNQNVKDAFQNNLNQLNQILKDNGFENAALDVFVGQHQQEEGQQPDDLREEFEAFKNARSMRALDQAVTEVPAWEQGSHQGALNMVM